MAVMLAQAVALYSAEDFGRNSDEKPAPHPQKFKLIHANFATLLLLMRTVSLQKVSAKKKTVLAWN